MKTFIFLLLVFLAPLQGNAQTNPPIWTKADRLSLLNGLQSSQANLLKEVEKLDDEQLNFKPGTNQWSVAEVVEHLGVYEELLYWDLVNNQYTEERPDLVDAVKGVDSAMVSYASDPNKGQAPFVAQPIGRFNDKKSLIDYFCRFRNEVAKLVQETETDFRLHFIFRPKDWGIWHVRDLHQYTLLWIAHTERHIAQIQRIKGSPGFP